MLNAHVYVVTYIVTRRVIKLYQHISKHCIVSTLEIET